MNSLTRRFLPWYVFSLLLGASLFATAQSAKPIRVCVPLHTAKDAQLHQVAGLLSEHKPDKSSHLKVEGIEVPNLGEILHTDNVFKGSQATQTLSPEAQERARQNQCDYMLVVSVPDVKSALSGQPNAWNPEAQTTANTRDPYMRRQDPELYVQIKYRLYRIEPAGASDGFVTTHQAAPQQAVVTQALDMLANQVFAKVVK